MSYPGYPDDAPDRGFPALRIAAAAVLVIAAAALAGTVWMWRDASRIARVFSNPEDAVTLDESAWALGEADDGAWWSGVLPGVGPRLERAAAEIDAGREELRRLAEAYAAVRGGVNSLGVPGRLLVGEGRVEPIVDAMRSVTRPWHRQTLVYQEVALHLEPYLVYSGSPANAVAGTVIRSDGDRLLVVAVRDASGGLVTTTSRLGEGDRFSLPLDPGYRITAAAWGRTPAGTLEQIASRTFPLTSWPDGPIVFPRDGLEFHIAFDDAATRRVPPLEPLTESARRQLEP